MTQGMNEAADQTASLFEEHYLIRTLGRIAHDPEVALTELVANAWDAGASRVDLTIPSSPDRSMIIEDDGHGMSSAQFKSRWMKLGYDRTRHQGPEVEFPLARRAWQRRAYGRNGVGRHGLLCFSDHYWVETWRDQCGARFEIGTQNQEAPDAQDAPFRILTEGRFEAQGSGTRLSVLVNRHLPDAERISHMLSARFLHDPQFVVRVNGRPVALADRTGLIERTELAVEDAPPVQAYVVDAAKAVQPALAQGIAFWVNGRLVGIPSWLIGANPVIDSRARIAQRYAIAVYANHGWLRDVESDWLKFKSSPRVAALFDAVRHYVQRVFATLASSLMDESSEEALMRHREQFKGLSLLGRAEVASFARDLAKSSPAVSPDVLSAAVQALINLERARGGAALLEKLTQLGESDIDGLDRLLGQWSVRDALSVLDEIDHRLAVLAAIDKLCGDEASDELQTLHPLVTQARWLFGPEFDSSEYASNVSLKSAAEKIFKRRLSGDEFAQPRQRPDLLVLGDATCSIVGTEGFDAADPMLTRIQNVLIIELKKGKSVIGREAMNQADGYVQDFLGSGAIDGTPMFRAFVVGHEIAARTTREKDLKEDGVLRGKVHAVTYGQLTRSAHQRLFRLRERLPSRYEEVSGSDLSTKVMQTPSPGGIHSSLHAHAGAGLQ
ncbi:ATP-binding protein [Roseateles amylovorans]|uniref:ATP-binding protein n=1 Tax=Roseateles amylovorans TaxID=2978473 RepID=A0ABY6AX98_9BURK|nr:ATP-binding protein [Roseateles amylovorans]UXH76933.1 ATP-binding protein [Roseateles amylovorans]